MSVEHVRPGPDGDVRLDLEQRFASRAVVQDIVSKMPPAASPSNPLADQQWVRDLASQAVKDKADKAVPQTAGNLAALTQDGNLADSGKKPADYEFESSGIWICSPSKTPDDEPLSVRWTVDPSEGEGWAPFGGDRKVGKVQGNESSTELSWSPGAGTAYYNIRAVRSIEYHLKGQPDVKLQPAGDYASGRQGAKADTAVQPAAIAGFVDGAEYDAEYGAPPKPTILLKHGSEVVATVDAADFVIDGMVSNVEVKDGSLVITFNIDSGKQPISIPLTDIFDPDNYYTKTDVNGLLAGKVSKSGDDMSGDLNVIGSETRMIRVGWNKTEGGSWAGFNQTGIFRNGTANYLKLAFPPKGGIFARLNDIADVFSPSTTYAKDSLCIYPDGYSNGVLYRCKNPNGHTGAWVAADFEEAPVEVVLAGKASKADATLTPIYSNTPTFSEWDVEPATATINGQTLTLVVFDKVFIPDHYWCVSTSAGTTPIAVRPYDPTATSLAFTLPDGFSPSSVVATRTRTDIIGYTLGSQTNKQVAAAEPLLLARYYPEGNVKSAAEFTEGIKYNFDTTNHTATVKPFCNTGNSANDNSSLVGRVVIPPFVDAQDNGYISDDGTRYKVVGVGSGTDSNNSNENLTAVIAPSTVANIEDKAFRRCTKLKSASIPAAMSIGGGAFNTCSSLVSVSLSAATSIGTYAFNACTKLVSVSLPAVTRIDSWAFYNCTSLASVSLPVVTRVDGHVFDGCIKLVSVSLPVATTIGGCAFYNCTSLASVSLPAAFSVDGYAFYNCTSLESVDFGATLSSVSTLGSNAFNNVPKSCKIIVPDAQYDAWIAATNWSTLYANGYKFLRHSDWEYIRKYEIDSFFFAQYYPEGNVKSAAEFTAGIKYDDPDTTNRTITVLPFRNTGTAANDNSDLAGRVVIPPFVDGDGNPYISDNGTRFKVVGVSNDGSSSMVNTTNLTAIVAPNTVTNIGDYAFSLCIALTSVSLPGATTIGTYAFAYCTSLTSVSLPGVTNIEENAFANCTSLTSVSLPAATTIGTYAFAYCAALTSVSLPAATTVGDSAFDHCTSLTIVSLPAATTVGAHAFSLCRALTSVSLPAATTVGDSAFAYCAALTSVSLPAATTVGAQAFYYCTTLSAISLPDATSIGVSAFKHCRALTSVDFGDMPRSDVPSLGSTAFNDVPNACRIIVPYTQYDAWIAADVWKDLTQEFVRHTEKADKPATFTTGNLAKFDSQGNPTNSGKSLDDISQEIQDAVKYAVVVDDKLVPTEGPGSEEVYRLGDATSYLAEHLPAWTVSGDFRQNVILRNRYGASEQFYHYDLSLFTDRIVFWVEGKENGEHGVFTRSIVFPKSGVYTLDIEYAAAYAIYPGAMGQARFVVDAGTSGPQDVVGINDPSIVQHAQVQFSANAGAGTISVKGKTGLSGNSCCVVIASVKVTLIKEIGIEIGDIVAPDASAQTGQAADAKATWGALNALAARIAALEAN